ncbi:MAG: OsmC family protein [Proteobacteria bacterium]|nr:OsmC family protein [Pseudomonadota bacterium]
MQNLPHHYSVAATSTSAGNVELRSNGLTPIESAAPAEFGGPGDLWSPETLLAAAVADCFILSFRAIAQASKLDWTSLSCDVEGILDRVEKVTRFTEFNLRVVLEVPAGTDEQKAMRILDKAEHACLITNSMTSETNLDAVVRISE